MSRSKNRKIADLISGGTFDDGVVAASEVTGLHTVASTGDFNELENKPAPFDPATLAGVAVSGSFNDLSDQPAPFDPNTLSTVAVSGSFNDLSDQPAPFDPSTLATVATTGAYSALSGKPSIPSAGSTPRYSSAPSVATEGSFYWHTVEDQLYVSDGTAWTPILSKPPVPTGGTITLPTAAFGTSYSHNFGSNVADPVFADNQLTYVLQSGSIPAGLSVTQNLTGSSTAETTGTYNFTVSITNPNGASALQSYTMTATGVPNNTSNGEAVFTTSGNWTVPAGVYNVCVVAVGAGGAGYQSYSGGGGGGGLAWANQISVTPNQTLNFTVGQGADDEAGGQSNFIVSGQGVLRAFGGNTATSNTGATGGTYENTFTHGGGGNGGTGGNGISPNPAHYAGGGGGAGGYSGNGGNGGGYNGNGTNGSGGGGGGGGHQISAPSCGYTWGAGGGGVGLNGQGTNGTGGGQNYPSCTGGGVAPSGGGGSGGADGQNRQAGGLYGGGGPSGYSSTRRGGHGGVRIVWKTAAKGTYGFPSSNVG